MELSGLLDIKDVESQKLLYKYQYAFLNMQKSFTSLIKIVKRYMAKKLLKSFKLWKTKSIFPYITVASHLHILKSSISQIEDKFRYVLKIRNQKTYNLIILSWKFKDKIDKLTELAKREKEITRRELKIIDSEVKNLKMSQVELEIITNYYTKNENPNKQKVQKIGNKTLIEKTRSENMELERQIKELDRKTIVLFQELNLVLDNYESSHKQKGKKGKKKSSIVLRKSLLSVCT